ncbi:hypothetical protein NQ317_002330 [Molorchus minor]|uniref:Uncharacterized protein n=1 Tax=Molorchus minor TaxID=1323400 RepID=A0ABQ9J3W8_9CUCU|nr:hypothetical protein NQ317_002330 [Molorchus minor]
MRSIIFANYIARRHKKVRATTDVEHSHVRFLGNLVQIFGLRRTRSLCGKLLLHPKEITFLEIKQELERDMHYYQSCLEAILQNSPEAKIFCLIHKMDLVAKTKGTSFLRKEKSSPKKGCHGL